MKDHFESLLKQVGVNTLKEEGYIIASGGKEIPVLLTVNSLWLDNISVLSIILTNLTKLKHRTMQLEQKNEELAFQNEEKEKRAAELVIANKELAFQNDEKEKRAAELVIANKELIFQIEEKEKRAAEKILANKELGFHIEEKEKLGAELIIAATDVKELEGCNQKITMS